ncbi:MAG: DNA-protecting protein DprA, partial [Bacteroidia bacterium]|nr:DNA-protecting protein DprA [Bacteroidia bacterium]
MTREELVAWLQLLSLEFSANKLRTLLERFGDPEGVLSASRDDLRALPGIREADIVAIERAAREPITVPKALEISEVRLVVLGDSEYPRPLEVLPDPPPALFVWGTLH